jgi:hypothetical protein
MTTYVGIADCHGIESFTPEEGASSKMGAFFLRASLNRQRHAVLYKADLDEEAVAAVNARLKDQDFTGALETLKDKAESVSLPDSQVKSWDLIPNPVLDPWR